MGTASIHEGVRRMRFANLLDRQERGEITQDDAAEMLGISVRTFQRWRDGFASEGDAGLADRRLGRPSGKRAAQEELERMLGLYRDKYADFTVQHFHEHLVKRHNYVLGYTVTKRALHAAGLVRKAPKRSAHRKKRPRRPMRGMLLHQDGSRHAWLEGRPALDLIVTLDDATSEIYAMQLVEEEGTASTFAALREVVAAQGLFCSLYTDRGSHYFMTPKAGEPVSKGQLTQVGRALAQLGIEHIAAYSPEARGRSERAFRTLQDRLPKELRLAGITTVEAANAWLRTHYIVAHNEQFAIEPEQEGSAFVPDRHEAWREVLCAIEERVVAGDNTIAWNRRRLQLPESRLRPHFVKATVAVHVYPDATLSVFWGPHRLAAFAADGSAIAPPEPASAPTRPSPPACSKASRTSPRGARKGASLTPSARAAVGKARVGTKERASSRTKEPTGRRAAASRAAAP
ncbi:MAG: ISNCY family transposase [Hyphomicrobiaceae bacterium]